MTSLPLMEAFYTIQGEGRHQGKAAYFIRLGGCDVGCHWCDVKESWDPDRWPLVSVETIVEEALRQKARVAVITGGEPLMYDLKALTSALQKAGFATHLETSGAYPLSGTWDWVCCSPKKFKPVLRENLKVADELKVIVFNKSDLPFATAFHSEVSPDCVRLLQPEWDKREAMLPLMIDFVKEHPEWQLSLQTHKYIGVP